MRYSPGGRERQLRHSGVCLMSRQSLSVDRADTRQEINVGLAADIGTLQRFPKIIGNDSLARELALTGRRFGPTEAKEMGFVSKVVSGGRKEVVGELSDRNIWMVVEAAHSGTAAAVEMAKVIAEKSPVAAVSTKHLMNRECI